MLDRIQAHDSALKDSRERYEIAVLGSRDGLWDWNLDGLLLAGLDGHAGLLGGRAEPNLWAFERLLHPEERDRVHRRVRECLSASAPVYEVEFRLLQKDGTYRWVLSRGAVLRDASGRPYRMAGSHTDIAERKRAELSLQDSERRLTRQNAALRALTGIRIGGLEALRGVFQEITTAAAETLEVGRASIWLYGPAGTAIDPL